MSDQTITFKGRPVIFHTPPSIDSTKPLPLVFMLPGLGEKAADMATGDHTGMSRKAHAEGFFVAYIEADGVARKPNHPDVGPCRGPQLPRSNVHWGCPPNAYPDLGCTQDPYWNVTDGERIWNTGLTPKLLDSNLDPDSD